MTSTIQCISNRRPLLAQSEEKDALLASEPAMVLGFVGHSRLGCNALGPYVSFLCDVF